MNRFLTTFDKIEFLIAKARGIEVLLRIFAELESARKHYDKLQFSDAQSQVFYFQNAKPHILVKQINITGGEQELVLSIIKNVADKIAHGLFFQAINGINTILKKHHKYGKPRESSVGMIWFENVKDESGKLCNIGYKTSSSNKNLFIEEFNIFEENGYYQMAIEMFNDGKKIILKSIPKPDNVILGIMSIKGLTLGKKQYK